MSTLRLAFVIDAVDKATTKVRAVNRTIDKMTEPARRVRAAFTSLIRESRFDRLKTALGEVGDRVGRLRDFGRSAIGVLAAVGVAAGGVVYSLKSTIDQTDRANDVAKKLGMSIGRFQQLGYAAQLNGASQEEMGQALQFVSQNMIEAINGSKEAALWFARVGIPLDRLKKMNAADVFEAIADKFQAVGDAGQNAEKKIAVMRALMGRSGAELKQVLDLGSDGLRRFYQEAERLGAVVSTDTAEAMGDFNDNFDRLKFSVYGVMAAISRAALPALDAVVRRVTAWSAANRELIGTRVAVFVEQLLDRLPAFLGAVIQIGGALASVIAFSDQVAQALGGWETVIAIVTGLILGKLLVAVSALTVSLWGLAAAFLATPFGWFVAGAAGVVALAAVLIKHWQPVKDFFDGLWDGVLAGFRKLDSMLPSWFKSPIEQAERAVTPSLAAGPAAPSALARTGGASGDWSGNLRIAIDAEGRPRVAALKTSNRDMEVDVYSGPMLAMP